MESRMPSRAKPEPEQEIATLLEPVAGQIPNKLYFRIGEVSQLAGVKAYVLRYWETEFPSLEPKKSGASHRLYRRKDVEQILEIKRLLYDKRFTIEGARKYLGKRGKPSAAAPVGRTQAQLFPVRASEGHTLGKIRRELEEIVKLLK